MDSWNLSFSWNQNLSILIIPLGTEDWLVYISQITSSNATQHWNGNDYSISITLLPKIILFVKVSNEKKLFINLKETKLNNYFLSFFPHILDQSNTQLEVVKLWSRSRSRKMVVWNLIVGGPNSWTQKTLRADFK